MLDITAGRGMIHPCDLDPSKAPSGEFFDQRHQLRMRISSLIDRGRWFFPNLRHEVFGAHKEVAFRGFRHKVLDSLVGACRLVEQMDYQVQANNGSVREGLLCDTRSFVSTTQEVLDHRSQAAELCPNWHEDGDGRGRACGPSCGNRCGSVGRSLRAAPPR
jgi:hypothetical protein